MKKLLLLLFLITFISCKQETNNDILGLEWKSNKHLVFKILEKRQNTQYLGYNNNTLFYKINSWLGIPVDSLLLSFDNENKLESATFIFNLPHVQDSYKYFSILKQNIIDSYRHSSANFNSFNYIAEENSSSDTAKFIGNFNGTKLTYKHISTGYACLTFDKSHTLKLFCSENDKNVENDKMQE